VPDSLSAGNLLQIGGKLGCDSLGTVANLSGDQVARPAAGTGQVSKELFI